MSEPCCPVVCTCHAYLACSNNASQADPESGVLSRSGVFDAGATVDKPTNAYVMMMLSHFSYPPSFIVGGRGALSQDVFDERFRATVLPRLGATAMTSLWGADDVQAILLESFDALFVVFAGSNSAADWFSNLDALTHNITTTDFSATPVTLPRGFFLQYNGSRDLILSAVSAKMEAAPFKKLWFTGHSLGSALTTLFATRAQRIGLPVAGVYTFGSPTVGDAAYVAAYASLGLASRTYQYVVPKDPIPTLPAAFSHPTPEISTQRGCVRRRLNEVADARASSGAAHTDTALGAAAVAAAAAAEGRDGERGVVASGTGSRRMLLGNMGDSRVPHSLLRNYAADVYKCQLSPEDRANVPDIEYFQYWGLME
ncbi:hypothetical protein HYH03_001605 [Edaphochlamys debaryana]|uniref:Fungal lipase-type domain-containing protein n=1 Tax=Edaphochlamys debaryana TaxID=47281 RepID=A0A836C6E6_9CHLO|nr:hypothetical protein HYH03_001605 [Edaphochlamys debaryana]|eukprot:KAG2500844.1 hypothetical protein HYH03_001605 [Edaphochlamys debaryana]